MGGFFGVIGKGDCVRDLFYGTDYHSHLGTKRGGLAVANARLAFQAFVAAIVSFGLRALRFHYFLRRSGISISFLRTLKVQLIGFALAVTPGRVGELFKLRLINEKTGTPVVQSAPLLLLDR